MTDTINSDYVTYSSADSFSELSVVVSNYTVSTGENYIRWADADIQEPRIIYVEKEPKVIYVEREPEKGIIYREKLVPVTETKIVYEDKIIYKEAKMFTPTNVILLTVLIIVVVKLVVPRTNWRYVVKKFFRLFYKPAREQIDEVKDAWQEAREDDAKIV